MAESSTILEAARAIAKALGQDLDTLPSMTFDPGSFGQDDFIRAAKASATAAPIYGSKRRPYYGAACLGVDGMGASLRLSDGSLELVFKDDDLQLINEKGHDLYISRLAVSEVLALRQWLIDFLPVSEAEISAGHGVAPPVSVTVPAAGSEERLFWLEAAEQHGFESTSGEEELPAFDPPAWLATEDEVLKLMAVSREQGRKDVLDALATGSATAAEPKADREALRKALTEITDAADKLILSLPGHWHDDATIELTDAASDARAVLAASAQNDLYDPSMDRAVQPRPAPECCVPDPGEPSFVLLGRDPQAPDLVERWAADRELYEPDSPKPQAARAIAAQMRSYKEANPYKGLQEVYTRVDGWKGLGRWETGIRNIVTILHGPRHPFEIHDIVEEVRALAETPRPADADPRDVEALRLPWRQRDNAVHDRDGRLLFGVNICTLEPVESLAITAAIVRIVNGAAQAGEGARG